MVELEGYVPEIPASVEIVEEGPREGFQFEKTIVPTQGKIDLIQTLAQSGLHEIRAVSFVNPRRVPGWVDADDVAERLQPRQGTSFSALWLNNRGLERALKHADRLKLPGVIVLGASERHLLENQNQTHAENVRVQDEQVALLRANGIEVRAISVMCAFGCNFEGEVPLPRVLEVLDEGYAMAERHNLDIEMIRLCDTMAWANPEQIKRYVGGVRERWPEVQVSLHLHDTRGLAMANAYAGLQMGVRIFDTSVGGMGGCPFAGHQAAAGNLCTEDFTFMCEEMGIETGIDLDTAIEAARLAERLVGHELPGKIMHGGRLFRGRGGSKPASPKSAA
jgi:hydroxymethylglutaryl-CoA lyase